MVDIDGKKIVILEGCEGGDMLLVDSQELEKQWQDMTDAELRAAVEREWTSEAIHFGKGPAVLIKKHWNAISANARKREQLSTDGSGE